MVFKPSNRKVTSIEYKVCIWLLREVHQDTVPHQVQTGAQAAYCGKATDKENEIFFSPSNSADA